jgi:signal transduction histidine kinase
MFLDLFSPLFCVNCDANMKHRKLSNQIILFLNLPVYLKRNTFLSLALICLTMAVRGGYGQAQNNNAVIDSLTNSLKNSNGTQRFDIIFELFRLNLYSNLEVANQYAQEALELSLILKDTLLVIKSYNALGFVKKEMGYPSKSLPYFEEGLKLARMGNYSDQVRFLLNNLGMANQQKANYAKALEYYLESLKLREESKHPISISVALNNIGVLYQTMGDFDNALIYFKRNYDLKLVAKEYNEFELCLINLADVSNALGKYEDAKKYLREVFDRCLSKSSACSQRQLALAYNAMGYSYLNTSDFVHAEMEFYLSAKIFSEIKSPDRADAYHALALVRYKMGDYPGALAKLNIAQSIAEETEIPRYQLKNYQLYGDIYSKQLNFKKAAEYQKKFILLNEEIYNADLIKNIARVQSEHQEESNLRTIAEKDQEITGHEERLAFQQKQVFFLVVITALIGIIATVLYVNQKRQAKSKLALELANKTIEEKNRDLLLINVDLDNRVNARTKELHSSNESLKKVNDELDNFIYKTSHDIRGPLSSLKGLTALAIREAKEESTLAYLNKLDSTASKLNKILTRLQIINQINHALLLPEIIDFHLMIDEILAMERIRGIPPNLLIETNISDGITLISDKTILKIILENLIDNGIKFSSDSNRKDSFVRITILGHDNGVTIKVLDNGIGIRSVAPEQVFKMFVRASERSESGGIGLYLAKASTEKLGGTIKLNFTTEESTEFIVSLPMDLRTVIKNREEGERQLQLERMMIAQRPKDQSKQIS